MRIRMLMMPMATALMISGCAPKQPPTTSPPTTRESVAMEHRTSNEESTSTRDLIGQRCRVRFRRDVLGVAGQAYVGPRADNAVPGQPLFVEGVVQSVDEDSVVLRGESDQLIWIPIGNVLLIETAR